MVRLFPALVAALFVCSAVSLAEEQKEVRKPVTGTYESYKDGTLVLKVDGKPVEYKVAPDFKTTVFPDVGEPRRDVLARESLKDVRPGTPIEITFGEGEKMSGVTIGKKR
jgi:hypothetical protein